MHNIFYTLNNILLLYTYIYSFNLIKHIHLMFVCVKIRILRNPISIFSSKPKYFKKTFKKKVLLKKFKTQFKKNINQFAVLCFKLDHSGFKFFLSSYSEALKMEAAKLLFLIFTIVLGLYFTWIQPYTEKVRKHFIQH